MKNSEKTKDALLFPQKKTYIKKFFGKQRRYTVVLMVFAILLGNPVFPGMLTSDFAVTVHAASGNTTEFAGGTGTEEDPYGVATPDHLMNVRKYLNAHYVQIADIDVDHSEFFQPIGQDPTPFTGTYNGAGYTISNISMYVDAPKGDKDIYIPPKAQFGLFGCISQDAQVRGVRLKNIRIEPDSGTDGNMIEIGALAGRVNGYAKVTECSAVGVTLTGVTRVGGLIGFIADAAQVTQCFTDDQGGAYYNSITSTGSGYDLEPDFEGTAGGFAGCINGGVIDNCYAKSWLVKSTGWHWFFLYGRACGFVGMIEGGSTVIRCYTVSPVKGGWPMAFCNLGSTADGNSLVRTNLYDNDVATKYGPMHDHEHGRAAGLKTYEMWDKNHFQDWDFDTVWKTNHNATHTLRWTDRTAGYYTGLDADALTWERIRGKNTSIDSAERDLAALPSFGPNGSHITWSASSPEIDIETGKVKRTYNQDVTVALTATISYKDAGVRTKTFDITIKKLSVHWEGEGTRENPYQISTAAQLNAVKESPTSHFIQINDINMLSYYTQPFGTGAVPFSGSYNGCGFEIEDLTIVEGGTAGGLFGFISGGALIENVHIRDALVYGDYNTGILAGIAADGPSVIRNCSVTGSVSVTGGRVGGLIGAVQHSGALIELCYANASVNPYGYALEGYPNYYGAGGGFVGFIMAGRIQNCYAQGTVSGSSYSGRDGYVGGFAGEVCGGIIIQSYAAAVVRSSANRAGFAARVTGSYDYAKNHFDHEVATVGQPTPFANAQTTANMKKIATFPEWNFITDWKIQQDADYPRLWWETLTPEERITYDVEQITWNKIRGENTAQDNVTKNLILPAVGSRGTRFAWSVSPDQGYLNPTNGKVTRPQTGSNKSVVLTVVATYPGAVPWTTSFNLVIVREVAEGSVYPGAGSGTSYDPYRVSTPFQLDCVRLPLTSLDSSMPLPVYFIQTCDIDMSEWGDFDPIGESGAAFSNHYNGAGYKISNLNVNTPSQSDSGLFGLMNGGSVKNVRIHNADVSGGLNVGILVGRADGGAVIQDCFAGGTVGAVARAGGLAGTVSGNSLICRSYSTASVTSTGNSAASAPNYCGTAGGFVGYVSGATVENCYSAGAVRNTSDGFIGGFAGERNDNGHIRYCYSVAAVSDNENSNGFLGIHASGDEERCYFDYERAGLPNSHDFLVLAMPTYLMKKQSTFSDWNFTTIWKIIEDGLTPRLIWQEIMSDPQSVSVEPPPPPAAGMKLLSGWKYDYIITVKDSLGDADAPFGGEKAVTVTGYTLAPGGTLGKIGDREIARFSETETVLFTNGVGILRLGLDNAAEHTLIFTVEGVENPQSSPVTVEFRSGEPEGLRILQGIESPAANGAPFAVQPVVAMVDIYGNITSDYGGWSVMAERCDKGRWVLSGSELHWEYGAPHASTVDGIATFTDLTPINTIPVKGVKIRFYFYDYDNNKIYSAESNPVDLPINTQARRFDLTMPESNPAGTPFPVTVKAVNITGAVDQSFTGMVKFYSTDPLAVLPQNAEFTAADNGVKSFNVTLNTIGRHTVTVSRPDQSLVGHWRFDEGSGALVGDSSGGGRKGDIKGSGTDWDTDAPGTCFANPSWLIFDGAGYAEIESPPDMADQSFSIGFWGKRSRLNTDEWIITQGPAVTDRGLHIGFRANNDFAFAFYYDDLNISSSAYTADTQWHHWLAVYDAATKTQSVYQDGKLVGQRVASGNLKPTGSMFIGRSKFGDSGYFAGSVDDLQIYGGALTGDEAGRLASGSAAHDESLLGHWRFDEGKGDDFMNACAGGGNGILLNSGTLWGSGTPGTYYPNRSWLKLSGSGYVQIDSAPDIANKSLSIGFWARRTRTGTQEWIIGHGRAAANEGLHIGFRANNDMSFAFFTDDLNVPESSYVNDTKWHHWLATYDAATKTQSLYQDGALVGTRTAGGHFNYTGVLYIGVRFDSYYFAGDIDDLRIYDRALSPVEAGGLAVGSPAFVYGSAAMDSDEIISVNIEWGSMEFTYSDGIWDPQTHSYTGGGWQQSDNANSVKVTNQSNVAITVSYTYTKESGYPQIDGGFTDGAVPVNSKTLPKGNTTPQTCMVYLNLSGMPPEMNAQRIGRITVTITS